MNASFWVREHNYLACKKFLFSYSLNVYVSLVIKCMSWSNSAVMRFFL